MNVLRKENIIVASCCVVFFLLACLTWWLEPVISRDGILYLELVGIWQKGGDFQMVLDHWNEFWLPPFYLWLCQGLIGLGIPPEVAGRGINILCGAMLPWIVYLIAEEVQNDKRVSLAAAILMALNPPMLELAIEVQRDMLYLALFGWCIYFCLRGIIRKEIWSWIPAGVLFSCSLLTRYETLELIPLLLLALVLFGFCKYSNWKRLAMQTVTMCVICVISFFCLLYLMGVKDYVLNSYQKYYTGKYTGVQMLYAEPGQVGGDAK